MGVPLKPDQIADIVTNTLRKYDKNKWTDISTPLQDYVVMGRLLGGKKVPFDGGTRLQWQVKVQNSGTAVNTGLFDTDTVDIADVMKTADCPWAMQKCHFGYDEREDSFQSDAETIVKVIQTRRHAAQVDLVELLENNFYQMPTSASDSVELLKPFGLPYWIVGTGATSTFGFNGGNPAAFSSGAGNLSSVTYPAWSNGNATYSAVSKADLVRKWREAATKCEFKVPVPHPAVDSGRSSWGFLTEYSVIQPLEELLESQNDNLGNDLAPKDGVLMFRGNPVIWSPWLDQNSVTEPGGLTLVDPVYGINFATFECVFKSGWFMKDSPPIRSASSHNVWAVFTDTSQQFRCTNRRRNFVLHKV